MAIKIIKFDLPINGTKVTTLEALLDNLTDEIVQLARSGQLERWFKSRQLQPQAQAVAAAVARHAKDKALFLALCAVLEVEVHPDDASAIFDAPPEAGLHFKGGKYFELYEELKKSHEAMQKTRKNIWESKILDLNISTFKRTQKIHEMRSYTLKVGVFGEMGAGKSRLRNALFGTYVCSSSDIEPCTRESPQVILELDGKIVHFTNKPHADESIELVEKYEFIYQNVLPIFDIVILVLKGDNRSFHLDQQIYQRIIKRYIDAGKPFLAVISQVDKIEPYREWDEEERKPGVKQLSNIEAKRASVAGMLGISMNKTIAVSAYERYGLIELVDSIAHELPKPLTRTGANSLASST